MITQLQLEAGKNLTSAICSGNTKAIDLAIEHMENANKLEMIQPLPVKKRSPNIWAHWSTLGRDWPKHENKIFKADHHLPVHKATNFYLVKHGNRIYKTRSINCAVSFLESQQ